MRGLAILFALWMSAGAVQARAATPAKLESNKQIVSSFYDLAFNQHQPALAMQRYVGSKYVQHNPYVEDGKQPFIDFFTAWQTKHPHARAAIKRLIAEGDLVVVHVHSFTGERDPGTEGEQGRAVMDIFRLDDGKIVEHWDVGQPVPEKSANRNTMF